MATPPNPERRRIRVQHSGVINPAELAQVRQDHAASLNNPPRENPNQAPVDNPPEPRALDISELQAAFAKAGQAAPKFNRPTAPETAREKLPTAREELLSSTAETPVSELPSSGNSLQTATELHQHRVNGNIAPGRFTVREILPSNGVFYNYPELAIRPLSVPDYAKLYRARAETDETLFIDTIAGCVSGVDVRDLSLKDFRYLLYKIRLISTLKSPYQLSYTSMYGNRCTYTVTSTSLDVKILAATAEEYQAWQQRGFNIPTLRDYEEYNSMAVKLSQEDDWLWSRAKYIQGSSVEDKIRRLKQEFDPDILFTDLEEFVRKFEEYGVTESVELADNKFNAQEALKKLREDLRRIDLVLEAPTLPPATADGLLTRRSDVAEEIRRLETELANTGEATPKRETITFSLEIADFFPVL